VNFILRVSPALTMTDVAVTMQLFATLEGADVVDVLHDTVATRMGSNRSRLAFDTIRTENLNVILAAMIGQHGLPLVITECSCFADYRGITGVDAATVSVTTVYPLGSGTPTDRAHEPKDSAELSSW